MRRTDCSRPSGCVCGEARFRRRRSSFAFSTSCQSVQETLIEGWSANEPIQSKRDERVVVGGALLAPRARISQRGAR